MQHDVGEYLGFLLPRLAWISNLVTWSCRLQAEDGGLIHNAKSQAQVLALDPAEGLHHKSLQVLLGNWHRQAQLHALDSEVDNLFLQIPRFQVLEGGLAQAQSPTQHRTQRTIAGSSFYACRLHQCEVGQI